VLGWQEAGLTLLPGQVTRLSHEGAPALTLTIQEAGRLAVAAHRDGVAQDSQPFSAGGLARLEGLSIWQTATGLAIKVSGRDASGNQLLLQPLDQQAPLQPALDLVFDQPRAEQVFLAPNRQLAFSIVAFPTLPERGFGGPAFLVQAFELGQRQPVFNEFVEGDGEIAIGGDRYALESGQFVTVRVSYDPGLPLLAMGLAVAALGLSLAILRPAGRLFLHWRERGAVIDVFAALEPSPAWRQAARWFTAWSATYEKGDEETSP
jgi:hypothetical protein